MLGTQNEVGIRIFNLIKELYKCGKHQINFDEDVYYHCRSRKKTEMPFVFDQMLKAPIGLPWAGRFNCPGRSYYYFSNTQKGAESEVKKHLKTDDVLQTVKIRPNCKIKLIDLSGTIKKCSVFLRYLRFNLPNTDDKWPKEYLLPSFVGECCKSVGFDGVKYYGAQDYNNYVTWSDGYFVYVGMCN